MVVHAALTTQEYATKIAVSDEPMAGVNWFKPTLFPEWNYTIKPALA